LGTRLLSKGGLVLVLAVTLPMTAACSKPQPNAPSQDFAQRHRCPIGSLESIKEGTDRMRVSGCGESELYVRSCENPAGAQPPPRADQPMTEGEARLSQPRPAYGEPGCAWTREHKSLAPPGSVAQPKWLSVP